MKRETKQLLRKAIDSLVLSVEVFNRPHDRGRVTTTLILLDHAFEMLLKSAIRHKGGRIHEPRAKNTMGFDACVRAALSNGEIKFLSEDQALLLQSINSLRDGAQHYILELSEGQLYMQAQAGLTLFRDLLQTVFGKKLQVALPERVLPLATRPPTDIEALFTAEVDEIRKLLKPGSRRQSDAIARLRPLAILDSAIRGEKGQVGPADLKRAKDRLLKDRDWKTVFPGVSSIQMTATGTGPSLDLRLVKKEGAPVQLVPEGTPGAAVVAIKRVNELDFYNLGLKQLAKHVSLTEPRALAVVRHLGLQRDPDCFKALSLGRQEHKRYSQHAVAKIRAALPELDLDQVWREHGPRRR